MSRDESGNFRRWTNQKKARLAKSRRFLPRLRRRAIASRHRLRADEAVSLGRTRCRKYFIGRDGLRPIWRLVLYLLMYRGLRFCLFVLLAYAMPDALFLWRQTAAELGLAIIALAPALLMSRIEGRAFGCYGLPLRRRFRQAFLAGRVVGNGCRSACFCWHCAGPMLFILGRSRCTGTRAEVCRVLGGVLPDRRLLRRILHPWVYPVHA